jgi:hypothetical protein
MLTIAGHKVPLLRLLVVSSNVRRFLLEVDVANDGEEAVAKVTSKYGTQEE